MKQPLWTTIIRTRGTGNNTLSETITSVAEQTYPSKSIVLVIHSKEKTAINGVEKAIRTLEKRIPISIVCADPEKRRGNPINVGLDHCNADYVSILDDDDMYYPDMGDVLISKLKEKDVNLVYGNTIISRRTPFEKGFKEISRKKGYGEPFNRVRLVAQNYLHLSSIIYSFREFNEIRTHEDMELWEDWYLLLKMLYTNKLKPSYVDHDVSEYRIIGRRSSNSFHRFPRKELLRNHTIIKQIAKESTLQIGYRDVFRIYPQLSVITRTPNNSDIQKLLNRLKYHTDIERRKVVQIYLAIARRLGKIPKKS